MSFLRKALAWIRDAITDARNRRLLRLQRLRLEHPGRRRRVLLLLAAAALLVGGPWALAKAGALPDGSALLLDLLQRTGADEALCDLLPQCRPPAAEEEEPTHTPRAAQGGCPLALLRRSTPQQTLQRLTADAPASDEATDLTYGVAVSERQGRLQWVELKDAGLGFAYIEASSGAEGLDRCYARNLAHLQSLQLSLGAVHQFDPDADGKAQASHYLSVAWADGASAQLPAAAQVLLDEAPTGDALAALADGLADWASAVQEATAQPPRLFIDATLAEALEEARPGALSAFRLWPSGTDTRAVTSSSSSSCVDLLNPTPRRPLDVFRCSTAADMGTPAQAPGTQPDAGAVVRVQGRGRQVQRRQGAAERGRGAGRQRRPGGHRHLSPQRPGPLG